jgi:3-oxoacyl-[acyl-carrier protein] reductase
LKVRNHNVGNRQIAVVTGGSRGIGRQLSRSLAEHTWDVAICSRSTDQAKETAKQLEREFGIRSLGVGADVVSNAEMSRFAEIVNNELGKPSVLICNAAVLGPVGRINRTSAADWSSALLTNVAGTANAIRVFWEDISRQQDGRILCLSGGGIGGPNAMRRTSAYTSSKSAIVTLVESLSHDLTGSTATINMLAPGSVSTTFLQGILEAGPDASGETLYQDARHRARNPSEELSQSLVNLVLYLLSEQSRHINGRLLSARWDTPEKLNSLRGTLRDQDLFTLRRIDDTLYFE